MLYSDDYNPNVKFIQSNLAYYDPNTDTVYYTNDESKYHEYYGHARPNMENLERLRKFYLDLNGNVPEVLKTYGANIDYVMRPIGDNGESDINIFYSPEELLGRVSASSRILRNKGVNEINEEFLNNARKIILEKNQYYGDNFRDLLNMYDNEHLLDMNILSYKNGSKLKPIFLKSGGSTGKNRLIYKALHALPGGFNSVVSKFIKGKTNKPVRVDPVNPVNGVGSNVNLAILQVSGLTLSNSTLNKITVSLAVDKARRGLINWYTSAEYKKRLMKVGFTDLEARTQINKMVKGLQDIPIFYQSGDEAAQFYKYTNSYKSDPNGSYKAVTVINHPGKKDGVYCNLDKIDGDTYGTLVHEMTHWMWAKYYDQRMKDWDKSLIKDGIDPEANSYFGNLKEIEAYNTAARVNYNNNSDHYNSFYDFWRGNNKSHLNVNSRAPFKDKESYHKYLDNFVSNDTLEFDPSGNLYAKRGTKIHIKKSNQGKFTDYCGGEVTDECIAKAKASGNKKLVKRATFAENARKWKHLNGGEINFAIITR